MDRPQWLRLIQILAQVLLVILLALLAVRIILETADIWIPLEYRMAGFPPDRFGFSTEDRVFWSQVDVDFLLGDHEIDYFDEYSLPDGTPMHNDRELRHMQDVYDLIKFVWKFIGWGSLAALALLLFIGRFGSLRMAAETLKNAARSTVILMILLGVGLVAAFGVFFVGFHRIFFEGDTWIFPLSDTFIRLYPERFWRDTFTLVVILTLVEAAILYLLGRYLLPRFIRDQAR